MPIARTKKTADNPFVMLPRHLIRLPGMSLKATGLWCLAMSYPDDWEFNLQHLKTVKADGIHALRSAFKELESVGLASLEPVRNEDGTLAGKEWWIYDETTDIQETTTSVPTDTQVSRTSENPDVGKTAHNELKNKEDVFYTMNQKEGRTPAREDRTPPSLEDVKAYANMQAIPEQLAEKFFYHYESEGWETRHGKVMRWQPRLQKWKVEQHKYTTNGSTPAARGTMKQL